MLKPLCDRRTRRAQPCPNPGWYEVDVPSPTMVTSQEVRCCKRHLAEVVDDAWGETQRHIEIGNLANCTDVVVRRVPGAPHIPSLMERLRSLGEKNR